MNMERPRKKAKGGKFVHLHVHLPGAPNTLYLMVWEQFLTT